MKEIQIKVSDEVELRMHRTDDANQLFDLVDKNRDHLKEWLTWVDKTESVEDSRKFIETSNTEYEKGEVLELGIYYQDQLVGCIGLHKVNKKNLSTEIGYWISKKFEGQGIMTKSAKALISYIFDEMKFNRVVILCAIDNDKSCAVPKRLNFVHEGVMRDGEFLHNRYHDLNVFSMLVKDW